MFVKLLQNIDTLKYHLYPDDVLTPDEISKYNDLLSNLVTLKSKAQTSKHDYCPYDNFTHDFKGGRFRVRPSTVRGFSVSLENADITIHLKRIFSILDTSPFAKIEFRAKFLQRFGYLDAVKECNRFLRDNIISHFVIKISELHLHCDIQGYKFTTLDFHRIQTRTRNNRIYEDDNLIDSKYFMGRSFQGFMLGSSDYLLRIYNKTKEIKKFPDKSYI